MQNQIKKIVYPKIMHGQQKIQQSKSQTSSLHRGQLPPPPVPQHLSKHLQSKIKSQYELRAIATEGHKIGAQQQQNKQQ